MNEARVFNFALIGLFVFMLFAYVVTVHVSTNAIGANDILTTVSAFCG